MEISGGTRVYGLLGDPVAHALSPVMQNAAFHALGLDAAYVALRCDAERLGAVMEALAAAGGGGNITIPHKEAAAAVLSRHGGYADPVCNTFWGDQGRLRGTETDSAGILAALDRLEAPRRSWCLVGTGGSARAALRAARQAGALVAVRSRVPERAEALQKTAVEAGLELTDPASCEVVINCTPLGLSDRDPLPIARADVPAARVALDLVYRRGETAWVRTMRGAGACAADGREVLVEQGAVAFERWFPERAAPREVMRAAVRFALG